MKIQKALLDLLDSTEFEHITVRAICTAAQINRSTFYTHYLDIYDLLENIEHAMSQELLTLYGANFSDPQWLTGDYLTLFLNHVRQHKRFYKFVLQSYKSFPIQHGFDRLWNNIIKPNCQRHGIQSENEIMYHFVYFQAGFTMVLKRWVETDCQETPEELCRIMLCCIPEVITER